MVRQNFWRAMTQSAAAAAIVALSLNSGIAQNTDVNANAQTPELNAQQDDSQSQQQSDRSQSRDQEQQQAQQDQRAQQGQQGQQGRQAQTRVGMGVRLAPSETTGVRVTAVQPNGPAMQAGIRENDYILAIDGEKIQDEEQFSRVLSKHQPNETVPITIWRNNARQELQVGLTALQGGGDAQGQLQAQSGQGQNQGQLHGQSRGHQQGQSFQGQGQAQAQYGQQQQFGQQQFDQQQFGQQQFGQQQQQFNQQGQGQMRGQGGQNFAARPDFQEAGAWVGVWLEDQPQGQPGQQGLAQGQERGVEIQRLYPGGPAARAGLMEGDRILAINGQEVAQAEAVSEAVSSQNPNDEAQFTILRNGQEQQVAVTLGTRPMFAYPSDQQMFQGMQNQMSAFDTIPEHEMMLEQHRRFAEQHERLEQLLMEVKAEVQQLRAELNGQSSQGQRNQEPAARPQQNRPRPQDQGEAQPSQTEETEPAPPSPGDN